MILLPQWAASLQRLDFASHLTENQRQIARQFLQPGKYSVYVTSVEVQGDEFCISWEEWNEA